VEDSEREGPRLLRWAVVVYGLLAAAALLWNGWAGRPLVHVDAAAAAAGIDWPRDLAIGLACAVAVIALSQAITAWTSWGAALARDLAAALGPLTLAECAALAALSGVAEELFFRGALQPRLGWLGASAVFAIAHVPPRRSLWPWTAFAGLAGLLLGALFAATGNLVAPIAAHAAINAVNLRLLTRSLA
jgi:membrane protease YdiL (CAAX protease family)